MSYGLHSYAGWGHVVCGLELAFFWALSSSGACAVSLD